VTKKKPRVKRKQPSVQFALTFPDTPYKKPTRRIAPVKSVVVKPKSADNKSQYFTKQHENAILEYASISDNVRKTYLYVNFIQPAFNEMVEKIVYTYKFNNLPNIEDLKNECKVFLTTILDKYDINRGSKAFSYFSVITKNWFIHKVKKNNNKKEVYIEDMKDTTNEEELVYDDSYLKYREKEEFWSALEGEMTSWFDKRLKENEVKVYKAIIMLFQESENIEIFNKKAIYLYMREITGLNTKQVVNNLKKFRYKYEDFRERWYEGKISHIKSRIYKDEF
jgi:mannose-6-phosphate isomerase-like protein (cupin superfamily)